MAVWQPSSDEQLEQSCIETFPLKFGTYLLHCLLDCFIFSRP